MATIFFPHIWMLTFFFFAFASTTDLFSQAFIVKGTVSTSQAVVKYVSVTFTSKSDPSKKYSTLTDNLGNFQLNIPTVVSFEKDLLPQVFELAQNYPNPFTANTIISYMLNTQMNPRLRIFDILGREIKSYTTGLQSIGGHEVLWDGSDNFGHRVAPGAYFYRLQVGNETQVRKMVLGAGFTTMGFPIQSTSFSGTKVLLKEGSSNLQEGNYSVQIKNTDNTLPRILDDQFEEVAIQGDTSVNFIVDAGKIVFESRASSNSPSHIYVMNPDGSGLKQLTSGDHTQIMPRWSFDGSKIVFVSDSNMTTAGMVMYIMNADGSQVSAVKEYPRPLPGAPPYGLSGTRPTWSPDGNRIVFEYCVDCESFGINFEIFIVNLTTGEVDQMTKRRGFDGQPVWSPDGEKIYFCSDRLDSTNGPYADIFSMNIDGSEVQTVTRNGRSVSPSFSPDGGTIAFVSDVGGTSAVSVMNADGSNTRLVTLPPEGGGSVLYPRWSPTGKHIIFSSGTNIFVVDFNGTILTKLTPKGLNPNYPDWNGD